MSDRCYTGYAHAPDLGRRKVTTRRQAVALVCDGCRTLVITVPPEWRGDLCLWRRAHGHRYRWALTLNGVPKDRTPFPLLSYG